MNIIVFCSLRHQSPDRCTQSGVVSALKNMPITILATAILLFSPARAITAAELIRGGIDDSSSAIL